MFFTTSGMLGFGKIYTQGPPGPVIQGPPGSAHGHPPDLLSAPCFAAALPAWPAWPASLPSPSCPCHSHLHRHPQRTREGPPRESNPVGPTSHLTLSLRVLLLVPLQLNWSRLSTFLLPTPRLWTPVTSAGEIFSEVCPNVLHRSGE